MANMSYCRFENTYNDLADCSRAMDVGTKLSEIERQYRDRLIKLCHSIADDADNIVDREAAAQEDADE